MTKLILILSAAAGLAVLTPDAAAASCAGDYVRCLNDSYDYPEPFQTMADVECAAKYVGCLRRAVLNF